MAPTLTALEDCPAVAVIRGSDVSPAQHREILAIVSEKWRNADRYLDDFARVMRYCAGDMLVRLSNGRIDGVLRTKCVRTWGKPHKVPGSFEELVGRYWSRRDRFADTRILVDLTKRDGANGVARSLIAASLEVFREPNVATFSPEDRAALHAHFGAYPVGRIENGRPGHEPPDVILMRYRGFSSERRWQRPLDPATWAI